MRLITTREALGGRMLSIVATSRTATVWLLLHPDGVSPDPHGGQATILHSLEYGAGALAENFAIQQAFEWLGVAETHADIIAEGEWLTVEQLATICTEARDWLEQGRIFAVSYEGQDHVARYQLDGDYKPWPVVADVIRAFGPGADPWSLAAWFSYPNGWIAAEGGQPLPPSCAVDCPYAVRSALAKRGASFVA